MITKVTASGSPSGQVIQWPIRPVLPHESSACTHVDVRRVYCTLCISTVPCAALSHALMAARLSPPTLLSFKFYLHDFIADLPHKFFLLTLVDQVSSDVHNIAISTGIWRDLDIIILPQIPAVEDGLRDVVWFKAGHREPNESEYVDSEWHVGSPPPTPPERWGWDYIEGVAHVVVVRSQVQVLGLAKQSSKP